MHPDERPHQGPGAAARLAELETENARLRQSLVDAEQTSRRLVLELQHRVRNTLAVVRSVVRRSARTGGTVEDYAMHLEGRLNTIARVGTMTARDPTLGVHLEDLFLDEMLAHAAHKDGQVTLSGPAVRLAGKAGELLALVAHELTVNAVKFGALSSLEGRIGVTWRITPASTAQQGEGRPEDGRRNSRAQGADVLMLEWRETGVPIPVVPPSHRGFGREMVERTLAYELDAKAALSFTRDGACCTIALPLTPAVVAAGPER